jgi:hypothetical protein
VLFLDIPGKPHHNTQKVSQWNRLPGKVPGDASGTTVRHRDNRDMGSKRMTMGRRVTDQLNCADGLIRPTSSWSNTSSVVVSIELRGR